MKPITSPRVDLLLETGGGGAGRHVLDLYAGLRRKNWDARLILSMVRMDATFAQEVAELPPAHVTLLKLRRSPHFSDLPAVHSLRRRLRSKPKQHILHAHSTKAGMIGWALGNLSAKRILTPHAYRGMDPALTGLRRSVVRRAERMFSMPFDAIIAVSETEEQYALSLGIQAEKIYTVKNGVDLSKLLHHASGTEPKKNADQKIIGFVGRLVHQKNPLLFIQVMAQLIARGLPVRARIIGDGPLRPHLQEFAAQLGIAERFDWCGAVSAVEEIGKLDALVHTSHYESSPYTLLEAAAARVPVVAVANAGSCSLFEDHLHEALTQPMDVLRLADGVEAVLSNPALREHYFKQYEVIVANHSVEKMIDETIAVYSSTLNLHSKKKNQVSRPRGTNEAGIVAQTASPTHVSGAIEAV